MTKNPCCKVWDRYYSLTLLISTVFNHGALEQELAIRMPSHRVVTTFIQVQIARIWPVLAHQFQMEICGWNQCCSHQMTEVVNFARLNGRLRATLLPSTTQQQQDVCTKVLRIGRTKPFGYIMMCDQCLISVTDPLKMNHTTEFYNYHILYNSLIWNVWQIWVICPS